MKRTTCEFLVLAVVLAMGLVPLRADTLIYSGEFKGDAAATLEGQEAGAGRETWRAPGGYHADGSYQAETNGSAWLPLDIEPGRIYKISADVVMVSADDPTYWVGIGFGTDSLQTFSALTQATRGVAALTLRWDGKVNAYVNGGDLVGTNTGSYGTEATFSLVLHTHDGETPWTVDFYIGGELWQSHEFEQPPDITRVALGNGGPGANAGLFQNFVVTEQAE
jgi:hypothetical protein